MMLLKQEAGKRVETEDYIYYVNEHPRYGWSVGRKCKINKNNKWSMYHRKRNSRLIGK
jgi:hypothetical protein